MRPPAPRGLPVLGNLVDWIRDPFDAPVRWAQDHGGIVELRMPGSSGYLLFEPGLVQELLVTRAAAYRKSALTRGMSCVIGESVVTLSGEPWAARRRLLNPAMRRDKLGGYAHIITAQASAYARRWASCGRVDDLHAEMLEFMFDVLLDVLTKAPVRASDREHLRRGFEVFWDDFSSREFLLLSLLFDGQPYRVVTTPRRRRQLALLEHFDRVIGELAAHHRAHPSEDLMSELVTAWEGQGVLGARQLREDVVTLILAAQETTAMGLTMALDLLMRHGEVAGRLDEELSAVLGGRDPVVEDLAQLPYLDAVVREVLRLRPPIWGVAREATEVTTIGGYRVEPGTQVIASAWVIQRSPRFWGEDALEFRPERWLEEGARARFSWFPFGAGAHVCIGMRFALVEMALTLACWCQRSSFRPLGPAPELVSLLTTRPKRPVAIAIEARESRRLAT